MMRILHNMYEEPEFSYNKGYSVAINTMDMGNFDTVFLSFAHCAQMDLFRKKDATRILKKRMEELMKYFSDNRKEALKTLSEKMYIPFKTNDKPRFYGLIMTPTFFIMNQSEEATFNWHSSLGQALRLSKYSILCPRLSYEGCEKHILLNYVESVYNNILYKEIRPLWNDRNDLATLFAKYSLGEEDFSD